MTNHKSNHIVKCGLIGGAYSELLMLKSFFPNPKIFFFSALLWSVLCVCVWKLFGQQVAYLIGFDLSEQEPIIGLGYFITDAFIFFYIYFLVSVGLFALAWFFLCPHPWQRWSVLGSILILFLTYMAVQLTVVLNLWQRPFGDSLQFATSGEQEVTAGEMYGLLLNYFEIASVAILLFVVTRFFVSHYIFRWRTAMNEHYVGQWQSIRTIEGASQRVQEDTMRFSTMMEELGVMFIDSIMTLIAFMPLLWALSEHVTTLPLIGVIEHPLLIAALVWSTVGILLLTVVGIKLPGLEYNNQKVEAAYRKELVYGEDNADRAQRLTLAGLFSHVRVNYFRLYAHYMYFNVFRKFYLNADNVFLFLIMIPTLVTGTITYGIFVQILSAFRKVSESLLFLVQSWPTVIQLLSVIKRLLDFDKAIEQKRQVQFQ